MVGIAFGLVPVLLALYLLNLTNRPAARAIGFDLTPARFRPRVRGADRRRASAYPGSVSTSVARALGLNTQVQASGLADNWWTIPVLVLAALQNALLEEVVMIGYLFTRLRQLGWTPL